MKRSHGLVSFLLSRNGGAARSGNAFVRRLSKGVRRLAADRRGVTAALTGASLMIILGVAGLGTEVASWYVAKRSMQGAADAAAFSAAVAASRGTSYSADGTAVAASFGFVNGAHGATVAVNNPPTLGPHAGLASSYEVIITQPQTQLFSKLFMASAAAVSARAVATQGAAGDGCVLALSKAPAAGVTVNGSDTVSLSNCSLKDNATGPDSLTLNGNASLSATSVTLGGGDLLNGPATLTAPSGVQTDQPSTSDPYASMTPPAMGACDHPTTDVIMTTQTINPGVYCGGILINGATVTLNSGIYYMNHGSFTVNGNSTVTGTGVTIFLTSDNGTYGQFTVNGTASVTLTAMTTGPTAGIAVYEDRNAPSGTATFNGGNHVNITGVLYFPTRDLTFNGQGTSTCTQLVAQTITFNGNATFGGDCAGVAGVDPLGVGQTKLVE